MESQNPAAIGSISAAIDFAAGDMATAPTQQVERFERTVQILREYFQSNDDQARQEEGPFAGWNYQNKFYFLKGILTYAEPVEYSSNCNGTIERRDRLFYAEEFARVFGTVLPSLNAEARVLEEERYLQDLYDRFIKPCKSSDDASETSSQMSSESNEPPPGHQLFSESVYRRDGACLFCWAAVFDYDGAVHLIQREPPNVPGYSQSLLAMAGIEFDDVQNGMLVCLNCGDLFEDMSLYVDVEHSDRNRFLIKFVPNNDTRMPWVPRVEDLKGIRGVIQKVYLKHKRIPAVDWMERRPEDEHGEMEIYFARESDPREYPSEMALRFHKAACLIWRMGKDCTDL
ncbi:hypothetical protein HDU96_008114 [Phlyctochytrium bullatum]|nr:hypothetical protein HDU96_008114 [Phlyctochytrium bullatum]